MAARPESFACVVGAALLILGCGGGDEEGSAALSRADRDEIETLLVETQTRADPAHCTELYTPGLVEKAGGPEACARFESQGGEPDSIEITSVDGIAGESATATMLAHGGEFEGVESQASLVYEEGRWKLDDFTFAEAAGPAASEKSARELRAAIRSIWLVADPAHCTRDYTEAFVAELGGPAACEKGEVESAEADSIEISNIRILPGISAKAIVAINGGSHDGERLEESFLYEDGRWKLDH